MASFAKEANEAAKALSTTTTNYTDASLIYYQQGLSDEEVKKIKSAFLERIEKKKVKYADEIEESNLAIAN